MPLARVKIWSGAGRDMVISGTRLTAKAKTARTSTRIGRESVVNELHTFIPCLITCYVDLDSISFGISDLGSVGAGASWRGWCRRH